MNQTIFAERFSSKLNEKNIKQVDLIRIAEEKGINLYRSGADTFALCCRIGSLLGL